MDSLSVTRGEFVYRDVLLVDVGGDGKRHARASESELKAFLDGKSGQKDQVAHWYEAQLIHYALQRSKDKNTAKVRLQQALNQGQLTAPPHIADMEGQMKKEYAAAVRKAKKLASGDSATDVAAKPTKKRKTDEVIDESSKRTKITMTVGGIAIDIEHADLGPAKSKSGKITTSSATKAAKKVAAPKQSSGSAATPVKTLKTPKTKATVTQEQASPPPAQQPAKKGKAAATSPRPVATSGKASTKATAQPKVKAEPKTKAESNPTPASRVKAEPKSEPDGDAMDIDSFASEQPGHRNVTGVYTISCPLVEDQYPKVEGDLRLFLCVDEGKIWGGFELGPKSGVLCTSEIVVGGFMSFEWRARDCEDGRLTFGRGRGCFGEIELYGRDRIGGRFTNLFSDTVDFDGQRRPGPLWCGRSAYSFEQEWEGFVSEAYGR
ncbi:hypothetical protein LTR53_012452 [Teratosphaeriaceae sp. CCFEE 6253]|nr:hypothetical protein LTR53_012452 [Teratosphaeriaceae sp. CCFEE 6253]